MRGLVLGIGIVVEIVAFYLSSPALFWPGVLLAVIGIFWHTGKDR